MENSQEFKIPAEPLFSEERYQYFKDSGLTKEEIQILERAEAASRLAELLPDGEEGVQAIFDKIEALPDNPGQALDSLHVMAEKDPESYAQILALIEALDMAHETEEPENN